TVARHSWHRQPPGEGLPWAELPDPLARRPEECLEQRAQLDVLSRAIRELTDRQREVFVAVALNDVPIDVLAAKLGSNRNAIYNIPLEARRRLRARMAAAGHPICNGSVRDLPVASQARLAARAASKPQ